MYSGTTLTPLSGRIIGGHQKFDRVARHHLGKITPAAVAFPKAARILHFEGRKGPDAIKRKSPSKDEPWHFYSPFNDEDSGILELINDHYKELVKQLKQGNEERSAFEAAWLAHALVDGLTPAHHYPYEEELNELRGEAQDTRDSLKKKIVIDGKNRREKIQKNWKAWGPRGLISTHTLFEVGIATMIAPLGFKEAIPTDAEIATAKEIGLQEMFKRAAREIAVLEMYDRFLKRGWTTKLVWQVRHKLAPTIIRTVALAWYLALVDSGLTAKSASGKTATSKAS